MSSVGATARGKLVSAGRERGIEALAAQRSSAAERPALKADLTIRRLVQLGEVTWAIKNPETQKVYMYEDATWQLVKLFDGTRTRVEILEEYNAQFEEGTGLGFQFILDLEESLHEVKLLERSGREKSLDWVRSARRREAEKKAEGVNPLYMMFHLFDPDRFLTRTQKYVRWMWTPPAVAISGICILWTLGVFVEHWDTIWRQTLETYAFYHKPFLQVVQFFAVFVTIGAFHEFAHGYVTKFYGGEVHSIGMALIYGAPALYCDTGDSTMFESKWQRLWVSLAGIYIEAWMSVLATLVWTISYPDTFVHEFAYKTMLYTGVSTVFFNINPLVKIDGYWALTDLLGLPALREDAFAYLGASFQRHVLRLNVPVEPLARRRKRIYIVFATLAMIYAGFVMAFIGSLFLNFYGKVLPDIAVVLMLATMFKIFRKRVNLVVRVGKLFYLDKKELLMSRRMRPRLLALAAAAVLLLAVPWGRRTIQTPIELRPAVTERVEAPEAGVVTRVAVREGDPVKAGDLLLVLGSKALESRAAELSARRERLEKELSHDVAANDARRSFQASSEREAVEGGLREVEARRRGLEVRSPIAGTVLTRRVQDLVGRAVTGGALLAEVGDCTRLTAEIPVSERLLTDLSVGEKVAVQLRALPLSTLRGTLLSIAPASLAQASLVSRSGESLRPSERPGQFVALAAFENGDGRLRPGMAGLAKLYGRRASPLGKAWRIFWHWFRGVAW